MLPSDTLPSEIIIRELAYHAKCYDAVNKTITSSKTRLAALWPGAREKDQDAISLGETAKSRLETKMKHCLGMFPIYTDWMSGIRGCGPFIAANIILCYYFRFVPVCAKCGTDFDRNNGEGYVCPKCANKARGDGILKTRVEVKDFPNISKWWKYMGRDVQDGKVPRKKKGQRVTYSTKGKAVGFHFGEQVEKQKDDHPYKQFYNQEKEKLAAKPTKPGEKPLPAGLIRVKAKHKSAKLFLAHFWTVARKLDGKPVSDPYAHTILGHTGYIDPWKMTTCEPGPV